MPENVATIADSIRSIANRWINAIPSGDTRKIREEIISEALQETLANVSKIKHLLKSRNFHR